MLFKTNDDTNKRVEYFNIRLKKGATLMNLLSMPMVMFINVLSYVFMSSQFVFILRDPHYFNISGIELASTSTDILFYSFIAQMVYVLFVGSFYDLFGRRVTLILNAFVIALVLYLIPYTSPHVYPHLLVVRIIFGLASSALSSNPQVNDYITQECKGRAIGLIGLGTVLGELIGYGVVLNLIQELSIEASFKVFSCLILMLTVSLYFMVSELPLKREALHTQISRSGSLSLRSSS